MSAPRRAATDASIGPRPPLWPNQSFSRAAQDSIPAAHRPTQGQRPSPFSSKKSQKGVAKGAARDLRRPVFLSPLPLPRRPSAVVHSSFAPCPDNVGCVMANRSSTGARRPTAAHRPATPAQEKSLFAWPVRCGRRFGGCGATRPAARVARYRCARRWLPIRPAGTARRAATGAASARAGRRLSAHATRPTPSLRRVPPVGRPSR